VSGNKTHHKLTKNNPALAQNLRGSRQFSMSRSLIFYGVSTRNLAWRARSLAPGHEI
jgi:hypothetical protein